MLIPRFTLRWLLGLITVSAVVSLVLAYAVRGQAWALGVTAGLWCLAFVALFYVLAFLVAWLIANLRAALRPAAAVPFPPRGGGENPFAPVLPTVAPAVDSPPAMTG
jgi:hypothetical protein